MNLLSLLAHNANHLAIHVQVLLQYAPIVTRILHYHFCICKLVKAVALLELLELIKFALPAIKLVQHVLIQQALVSPVIYKLPKSTYLLTNAEILVQIIL